MGKDYPEAGSVAAECWSIIKNVFTGRVSAEKMQRALEQRDILSVEDLIQVYGDHNGLDATIIRYVYLTSVRKDMQFGLSIGEFKKIILVRGNRDISGSLIHTGLETQLMNIKQYIRELLGARYDHSRCNTLVQRDNTDSLVRILLEGEDNGAPRVRACKAAYNAISQGKKANIHGLSASIVVKINGLYQFASGGEELDMIGAMERFMNKDTKAAWEQWKANGLWTPFYR